MILMPVSPQSGLNYVLEIHSDGDRKWCIDRGWFHAEFYVPIGCAFLVMAAVCCLPGVYGADIKSLIATFAVLGMAALVRGYIKSRVSTVVEVDRKSKQITVTRNGAFRVRGAVTIPFEEAEVSLAELKVVKPRKTLYRWGVVLQFRLEVIAILACSKSEEQMSSALGEFSRQLGLVQAEGYFEYPCAQWVL